ncbi:SDR family oxidoreductase [Actinomyces sp. ZJ308]|uniref:SDR family oxidoreductase n=1 Tax=Actinomyces sp. ZJ308 TaxID=2708342 RepID=UPI00141DF42E|nr:SDR family oxidoreductase [Actinomyces sp. ZJ308]
MNASAGLLASRTVLVTGVLRPSSIASAIAEVAVRQGARVLLTGHPRTLAVTGSVARGLGLPDPVTTLDVADADSLSDLAPALRDLGVSRLDGLVHSIARADVDLLGTVLPLEGADTAGRAERMRELERALTVSAASLPALVDAARPLLGPGSSVVTLTFDSARVWPGYGWMGPLKAALEASVRALAVELGQRGVRVNAVSSGPLSTTAASAIPDFEVLSGRWGAAAPLGWDTQDATAVARSTVALLSSWLPATTGQVIHVDGGAGVVG